MVGVLFSTPIPIPPRRARRIDRRAAPGCSLMSIGIAANNRLLLEWRAKCNATPPQQLSWWTETFHPSPGNSPVRLQDGCEWAVFCSQLRKCSIPTFPFPTSFYCFACHVDTYERFVLRCVFRICLVEHRTGSADGRPNLFRFCLSCACRLNSLRAREVDAGPRIVSLLVRKKRPPEAQKPSVWLWRDGVTHSRYLFHRAAAMNFNEILKR